MWLVVGLGNPGAAYAATRHNAGFMLLEREAASRGLKFRRGLSRTKTASFVRNGEEVLLALPQTFMNRSGAAVRAMLSRKGIRPERLVVVYDDLDIPLGEIRIRTSGSPGTHKGLKSVVHEMGSGEFSRIRIGIGPLPAGEDATDYVLAAFEKAERPLLEKSLGEAEEALGLILDGSADRAMALFNHRKKAL